MTLQDLIKPKKGRKAYCPQNMLPREYTEDNKKFLAYFEKQAEPVGRHEVMRDMNISQERFGAGIVFLRSIGLTVRKVYRYNSYAYWIEKDA